MDKCQLAAEARGDYNPITNFCVKAYEGTKLHPKIPLLPPGVVRYGFLIRFFIQL